MSDRNQGLMDFVSPFPCLEGKGTLRVRREKNRPMPATRRGFTLIELILVVAVLGVLISVAVPGVMSLFSRQKSEEAVNSILTFFGDVRREAIMGGKSWWVRYSNDVPGMIAGIEGEPSSKNVSLSDGVSLSGADEWRTLESSELGDVDISWVQAGWSNEIPFEPDGSSGDALITISAEGNRPMMIELRGLIGRGEVVPFDPNRELVTPELKETPLQ